MKAGLCLSFVLLLAVCAGGGGGPLSGYMMSLSCQDGLEGVNQNTRDTKREAARVEVHLE